MFLVKCALMVLGKVACETLEASTTSREVWKVLDEIEVVMVMESKYGVLFEFGGMFMVEV